ncbi:hypothetical protein AMAG_02877 [Allomyces macrogynus ATCC 38327]|uniref:Uncharacterized protein n=1 Tax=Allomyces macrogynus (strain ATCC 38327) TaxID=578462 RepID=A0A0L0S3I9_ALLM3|nr:hypothetical protein AMAG_02877 [Allomyces macrogynus ATCC 38327]|eukprot:KNE57127.1 hypothetical protein AMAG_02877 [Allomyces macrogynus ATCC 38327]
MGVGSCALVDAQQSRSAGRPSLPLSLDSILARCSRRCDSFCPRSASALLASLPGSTRRTPVHTTRPTRRDALCPATPSGPATRRDSTRRALDLPRRDPRHHTPSRSLTAMTLPYRLLSARLSTAAAATAPLRAPAALTLAMRLRPASVAPVTVPAHRRAYSAQQGGMGYEGDEIRDSPLKFFGTDPDTLVLFAVVGTVVFSAGYMLGSKWRARGMDMARTPHDVIEKGGSVGAPEYPQRTGFTVTVDKK